MDSGAKRETGVSRILNARERAILIELSSHHDEFLTVAEFATSVPNGVLEELEGMGLIERGTSERGHGFTGWRITSDGWRCMYGRTAEEIATGDATIHPLPVWRWPPDETGAGPKKRR